MGKGSRFVQKGCGFVLGLLGWFARNYEASRSRLIIGERDDLHYYFVSNDSFYFGFCFSSPTTLAE
jgi:hypothetical protein